MGVVDNGRGHACVGAKGILEISVPSPQFWNTLISHESKTLKNKVKLFHSVATTEAPVAKMKLHPFVTSDGGRNRKRHFSEPSHVCRRRVSISSLPAEPRQRYNVWSLPLGQDDEVRVVPGHGKGQQSGRAVQVYKKKYVIYLEQVQWETANGTTVHVGVYPSKVVITTETGQRPQKDP